MYLGPDAATGRTLMRGSQRRSRGVGAGGPVSRSQRPNDGGFGVSDRECDRVFDEDFEWKPCLARLVRVVYRTTPGSWE